MSDDSPQKGWDNWFDAEQDSPGGEQQASEQQVPPSAPQESEPETEAEQTSWTMPAIGAAPEGEAPPDAEPAREAPEPEPPQVQQPKPPRQEAPAEDAAPTQHIAAVADNQATQYVQAKPSAAQDTWQPEPAQARDPAPAANPWADAQPTTQLPQAPQGSRNQQAPGSQGQQPPQSQASQPQAPQQPSSSEQPTQVWTAAPAAQQPSAPAPQPPSQPPSQNPYAAATTQQPAQPQQPQQPPAYGAPPQGPPSSGYPGYQQQSGWDEQPERHGPGAASPVVTPAGPVPAAKQPKPQSNSRKKIFVSSGIGAVVIVALATILVMNNGSLTGSSHALAAPTGFQPTGTSVTADAEQTANAFLAAWQNGNFKQAASYTDDSSAAASTLASYASGLSLNGLQLTATGSTAVAAAPSAAASDSSGAAGSGASSSSSAAPAVPSSTAGVVTFNVVAKVGLPAATSTSSASASASASASSSSSSTASAASSVTANWSYSSKLTAYKKNGGWWIQWAPALVAPNLTAGEKVVSTAITPSAAEVEDANGGDLSSATDPGVHNIYLALKSKAPSGEGTPGVQIELESADGTPITSSADVLAQPVDTGVVKTTITPNIEAAAQQAVLKYPSSSMVVIQPTTGNILAVANNDGGNDFALTARVAPGSTDKILTSTALLANGLVSSPSQQVACPKTVTVNGTVFNNSEGESEPANTPFLDDFAISCNNAFGQWYNQIGSTTLANTAQKYYGLNESWDIGTGESATYYTIPSSSSNGELFQELFGQGELETAPIAMASVAATVDSGSFKQPVVVPGSAQVTATPLPTNVQQDLWQMMHAVVYQANGTAYNVFSGVNSTVYGKTGTADVGSTQDKPNSWMVVFDPTLNVAIACVVLDAGYGASFAGPEAAAALKAMQ